MGTEVGDSGASYSSSLLAVHAVQVSVLSEVCTVFHCIIWKCLAQTHRALHKSAPGKASYKGAPKWLCDLYLIFIC